MSFHVQCFSNKYGKAKRGFPARYESPCSICGARIRAGEEISFFRKGAKTTNYASDPRELPDLDSGSSNIQGAKADSIEIDGVPNASASADTGALERKISTLAAVVAQLAKDVANLPSQAIDYDTLALTILPLLDLPKPTIVQRAIPAAPQNIGVQHRMFDVLLRTVSSGVNAYLAGPSGSGKTTAAQNVARALDLPFYYTGSISDAFALTGYMNAAGVYVRTPFREAYEHGGVFLLDELDASDPNATLALNALLANGEAAFPDRMVQRHPDCRIIAAANTYGHGGTHEYVGRNKLDGAFLKRFAFIDWGYDEKLETATAPHAEWCKRVQKIRALAKTRGLRVLITPRETYEGAKLLAAGLPLDTVDAMLLRQGMPDETWKSLTSAA